MINLQIIAAAFRRNHISELQRKITQSLDRIGRGAGCFPCRDPLTELVRVFDVTRRHKQHAKHGIKTKSDTSSECSPFLSSISTNSMIHKNQALSLYHPTLTNVNRHSFFRSCCFHRCFYDTPTPQGCFARFSMTPKEKSLSEGEDRDLSGEYGMKKWNVRRAYVSWSRASHSKERQVCSVRNGWK